MRGQGRIVVYLANQNNLIMDVHFYESGWRSTQYMAALLLPFTPPNEFDTIMYSLERQSWIRLQPCMQQIAVLGLMQQCSNWQKVVVLKQLINQRTPTEYCAINCTAMALVVPKHRSVLCTVLSLVLIIYQYYLNLQAPISDQKAVYTVLWSYRPQT